MGKSCWLSWHKRSRSNILYVFTTQKWNHKQNTFRFCTFFKNWNLTTKIRRNKAKRAEYYKDPETRDETDQTTKLLEEISTLEPGKKAQLAAKKISEKYKKLREANAKKRK